jgi:adenine-specific DNA-methyltransferase
MVNLGNDITVLDSFAGSGTTAHSVMNLNKDKGNRKFILIELMDYANTITAERLKKAIDMEDVPSNSNFTFYELGEPMFKEDGNLNESIEEDKIREYIFFMETKQRIDAKSDNKYYLGTKDLTDYYFFYEKNKVTNLNYDFLSKLVKKNEVYIIYADKCTIGDNELDKYGIVFKKIPRDISRL